MAIHGAKCLPHGETYMGLVEVGVGLIPAGGGVKELMVRCTEGIPEGCVEDGMNLQQIYAKVFQNIAMAKVSTSAAEAMELGYIRKRKKSVSAAISISGTPNRQCLVWPIFTENRGRLCYLSWAKISAA